MGREPGNALARSMPVESASEPWTNCRIEVSFQLLPLYIPWMYSHDFYRGFVLYPSRLRLAVSQGTKSSQIFISDELRLSGYSVFVALTESRGQPWFG
jgi:hypothetical protein